MTELFLAVLDRSVIGCYVILVIFSSASCFAIHRSVFPTCFG